MEINCTRSICLGRVPDAFFDHLTFSNPTELIFDKELYALLRLCGADDKEIGEGASDYDRFKAYCNAISVLSGHPIVSKIEMLFKTCFGIDTKCLPDTCDDIWREVSNRLLEASTSGWDCLRGIGFAGSQMALVNRHRLGDIGRLPAGIIPVLHGNSLIETSASTWGEWAREITQAVDLCMQSGSRTVYFKILDNMDCEIPSLYHVGQTLQNKGSKNTGLLLMQLFRELCLVCNQKEITLYLEIECKDAARVVSLLERLQESVGLPCTVFFSRDISTVEAIIALSARVHPGLLRACFMTACYPSAHELEEAYKAIIARYPAGMLYVLCGDDLRYSAYEKSRLEMVLGK